jgi:hypothetical protein
MDLEVYLIADISGILIQESIANKSVAHEEATGVGGERTLNLDACQILILRISQRDTENTCDNHCILDSRIPN